MKFIGSFTTAAVILVSGVAMAQPLETLAKKQIEGYDGWCTTLCNESKDCPPDFVSIA